MKSTKEIIDTVLCILGHVENVSPIKLKELGQFLSIVPTEAGIPVLEVQSGIEILYNKFEESNELSFKKAQIDGAYVNDVLFGSNVELRMQYQQAQLAVVYHPRLLLDLHKELGCQYYKLKIQQALNSDSMEKIPYYSTMLTGLTAQETPIMSSATQVAKQYVLDQAIYGTGIVTNIPQIDNVIDYLTYKSLNIFMAPSANFKTTTACSIAYNAAMTQGKHVVYITLEDTDQIIWFNMLARHSFESGGDKVPASALKKYKLDTAKDFNLIMDIAKDFDSKLTQGSFTVLSKHNCSDLTPTGIELKLREISEKNEADIDMVVIDHFNLLNFPIKSMPWLTGSELQRYYVTSLTNLSITMGKRGFVLLGLAQLNREGQGTFEGGEMASSLHVAGTIELLWSATNFIYLFADQTSRAAGLLKGKIIKSRLGAQGVEFITHIQPAYCIVGNGADTTNPIKNPEISVTMVEDIAQENKNERMNQLKTDIDNGMLDETVSSQSLDELATFLSGTQLINSSEIIRPGKGKEEGGSFSVQ